MPDHALSLDDKTLRDDLTQLLEFVRGLLATRDPTVFDIAAYPVALTEPDLLAGDGAPLPGIVFERREDTWFSFARLREGQPPKPGATLLPWLRENPSPVPSSRPRCSRCSGPKPPRPKHPS